MQATGPVMSSVALWSQEQLGHQQGQAGGRGRTVLSVYFLSVILLVPSQAQASIPQVMLSETCDGIIYHVTLDRFHTPIFLWLPFFLVNRTRWVLAAVQTSLGSTRLGREPTGACDLPNGLETDSLI